MGVKTRRPLSDKGKYLGGSRVWASWSALRIPSYELYEFLGKEKKTGLYHFMSLDSGIKIAYHMDSMLFMFNRGTFRPFSINTKIDPDEVGEYAN